MSDTTDKIQEKLRKIKELADRGIGGEKEDALKLYNKLLEKYKLTDEDIIEQKIKRHYFRYKDTLDKKLLCQIFYTITGSPKYFERKDKRTRLVGIDCTDIELDMMVLYYQLYSEQLKKELDKFMTAFVNVNNLFPDETARCYGEADGLSNSKQRSMQEMLEIDLMASGMNKKTVNKQIEQRKED